MSQILAYDRPGSVQAAHPWLRTVGLVLAATLLVAICAHISVPLFFTPVPITLQTFAVLFLGLALGPRWSFAALSLYLLEGIAGLPVFNPHGAGGLLQLFGPTGGYLLTYPFAAAVTGLLYRRKTFTMALLAAAVGSVIILCGGAAWFAVSLHLSAKTVAAQAVVPFVPGDMLKVCAAAAAVTALRGIGRARG